MYSKLQYISQGSSPEEQLLNIKKVLDSGCNWIQLRFKNRANNEFIPLAEKARELTARYRSILIINDSVEIAQHIDADGVHLGLQDTSISLARTLLGKRKIIGGTANTIRDIQQRVLEKCNYIGLGPFRYTETKKNLSPILGLSGFQSVISQLNEEAKSIPIYAIGGIQSGDIASILDAGVYGIAMSAALTQSNHSTIIQKLINLKDEKLNNCTSGI